MIQALAIPSYRAIADLERRRFIDEGVVQVCKICLFPVDNGIETPCCSELYCCPCTCQWLAEHSTCPTCTKKMPSSSLKRPHPIVREIIANSTIHCDNYAAALHGCPVTVPLAKLRPHVAECPYQQSNKATGLVIRTVRPSSTAAEILLASPSKLRGNVADKLVGHLVQAKAEDGKLVVQASSRGQPQVYTRTMSSTVPSDCASSSTVRRRSFELRDVQLAVCGGEKGVRSQEVAGLKRMEPAELDKLLIGVGRGTGTPCPGTALAIKADLALSYSKFRQLRQRRKLCGIQLESERKMRTFVATQIPAYTAKELPMMKRSGEVEMAATVFFPDLVEVVIYSLDKLNNAKCLTWRNGIPESEVWLKIGGDHGGGTFKLSFQVRGILVTAYSVHTIQNVRELNYWLQSLSTWSDC